MRLPRELKLKILEFIANMACVSTEMRHLVASDDGLRKRRAWKKLLAATEKKERKQSGASLKMECKVNHVFMDHCSSSSAVSVLLAASILGTIINGNGNLVKKKTMHIKDSIHQEDEYQNSIYEWKLYPLDVIVEQEIL
ncbi:hypothetical protein YC2023_039897 [Brassica napus]